MHVGMWRMVTKEGDVVVRCPSVFLLRLNKWGGRGRQLHWFMTIM